VQIAYFVCNIATEKVMNLKSSQRFLVPFRLKTPFAGILFR